MIKIFRLSYISNENSKSDILHGSEYYTLVCTNEF